MFRYREISELTGSGQTEGDWVDFPASPEPDPWGALLRQANLLPADVFGTGRSPRQGARRQAVPVAAAPAHRRADPQPRDGKDRIVRC